jgi:hypothetical protein
MLVPYHFFRDAIFEEIVEEIRAGSCLIYGNELMDVLGIDDIDEFELAVSAAKRACTTLNISVRHHFRSIFLYDGVALHCDLKLSQLACYLVTMNADPGHPVVANAQLTLLRKTQEAKG